MLDGKTKTRVILNPASANGKTHRQINRLKPLFASVLGEHELTFTEAPLHATVLAREAVTQGYDLVLAVGGDGTNHETINGFFNDEGERLDGPTRFAFLASGTGGDFRRTLNHSLNLEKAVANLRSATPTKIDLGRATTTGDAGPVTRHYLNSASFGLSGYVGQLMKTTPKNLGATGSYLYATLKGLLTYEPQPIQIKSAERSWAGTVAVAGFCNGRYFGGGMKFAPHASPNDGRLDAVIVEGMSLPRWLVSIPKVYTGRHEYMDIVHLFQTEAAEVTAEGAGQAVHVELDGELTGTLPARFEVVPQSLDVLV